MPPATMTSASPALIACAASMTALSPEPHTLLTVTALTVAGMPDLSNACRAGAWPTPPWMTLPMMTSWTSPAGTPDRSNAAVMATAPSSGAESGASEPRNFPIGVLAAATMTGVRFGSDMRGNVIRDPSGVRVGSESVGSESVGSESGDSGTLDSDPDDSDPNR